MKYLPGILIEGLICGAIGGLLFAFGFLLTRGPDMNHLLGIPIGAVLGSIISLPFGYIFKSEEEGWFQ